MRPPSELVDALCDLPLLALSARARLQPAWQLFERTEGCDRIPPALSIDDIDGRILVSGERSETRTGAECLDRLISPSPHTPPNPSRGDSNRSAPFHSPPAPLCMRLETASNDLEPPPPAASAHPGRAGPFRPRPLLTPPHGRPSPAHHPETRTARRPRLESPNPCTRDSNPPRSTPNRRSLPPAKSSE